MVSFPFSTKNDYQITFDDKAVISAIKDDETIMKYKLFLHNLFFIYS